MNKSEAVNTWLFSQVFDGPSPPIRVLSAESLVDSEPEDFIEVASSTMSTVKNLALRDHGASTGCLLARRAL